MIARAAEDGVTKCTRMQAPHGHNNKNRAGAIGSGPQGESSTRTSRRTYATTSGESRRLGRSRRRVRNTWNVMMATTTTKPPTPTPMAIPSSELEKAAGPHGTQSGVRQIKGEGGEARKETMGGRRCGRHYVRQVQDCDSVSAGHRAPPFRDDWTTVRDRECEPERLRSFEHEQSLQSDHADTTQSSAVAVLGFPTPTTHCDGREKEGRIPLQVVPATGERVTMWVLLPFPDRWRASSHARGRFASWSS